MQRPYLRHRGGVEASDTVPAHNLVLRPAISPVGYTISYDLDGGTVATANPTSYNIESGDITLNNPTKEGYEFTGWTGSNGYSPSKSVTIQSGKTGNLSFTANWEIATYSITYNLGGGTVATANPTSYNYFTDTFTLNKPTRDGYEFTGWTGSNGSTPQKNITVIKGSTGDRIYQANWEEHKKICKINIVMMGYENLYNPQEYCRIKYTNTSGEEVTTGLLYADETFWNCLNSLEEYEYYGIYSDFSHGKAPYNIKGPYDTNITGTTQSYYIETLYGTDIEIISEYGDNTLWKTDNDPGLFDTNSVGYGNFTTGGRRSVKLKLPESYYRELPIDSNYPNEGAIIIKSDFSDNGINKRYICGYTGLTSNTSLNINGLKGTLVY